MSEILTFIPLLLIVALQLFIVVCGIYGIYLCFRAHILLGILSIFISPLGFISGIANLFFKKDIPKELILWLNKKESDK